MQWVCVSHDLIFHLTQFWQINRKEGFSEHDTHCYGLKTGSGNLQKHLFLKHRAMYMVLQNRITGMLCSWSYWTSYSHRYIGLPHFSFFSIPFIEAVYFSRYESCRMIQSWWQLMYNMILQDCPCMISILEPLLRLVSVLGELQSPLT